MPRVTMIDVAKRAGVAPSTVSRVLSRHPRISQATRERVEKAVEDLGFHPDPGAANLVAHRWRRQEHSGTLGVGLVQRASSSEAQRDDPLFARYAAGVGFHLDPIEVSNPAEIAALPRIVRARGLSGVLLEFVIREAEVAPLQRLAAEFPMVISNHRQSHEVAPSVVRDAYHRVYDAIHGVITRGYRRIGLALPKGTGPRNEMLDQMHAAFLLVKAQRDDVELNFILYQGTEARDLPDFVREHRLQALIGFDNFLRSRLIEQGLAVPEEIAFASMATDNEQVAGILETREKVIQESVELLRLMTRAGQTGGSLSSLRQEVRGEWVDGPSLPDRTSS